MNEMKKGRRLAALLAFAVLLSVLLSACGGTKCSQCGRTIRGAGHSTSVGILCDECYSAFSGLGTATSRSTGTGAWIAIIVMVFVAVFAATSGVVYLVLQKLLPPEAAASRPVRRRMPEEDYEDDAPVRRVPPRPAAPQPRPAPQSRPAASGGHSGEWICPRDRSRNSGPFCVVCGSPRSQTRPAPRPAQPVAQKPVQPTAQRPAQPAQERPASARPVQERAPDTDWQELTLEDNYSKPAQFTAQPTAPAVTPAPAYSGKFAKKPQSTEQPPAPPVLPQDEPTVPETEFDADLLAAIFREAERGTDEEGNI